MAPENFNAADELEGQKSDIDAEASEELGDESLEKVSGSGGLKSQSYD